MAPRVEVESRESEAGVVVAVRGSADVAAAGLLRELLLRALAPDRDVVLDLAGLERLDGAGLQILLAAKALVTRGGHSFSVSPLGDEDAATKAMETAGATALLASG
jgi:anti-anti-sigma factor